MQMTCIVHLCVVSHFHAAQKKDGKCKQNLELNSWPADMRRRTQAQRVWILAQLVEIFSNDGALSQKAEGLLVQSVPIPVGCALAHLHMHSISNHQLQAESIVKQDAQIQLHGISLQDPQSEESYSE